MPHGRHAHALLAEAWEKRQEKDPEDKDGKAAAGAPHVLITRTRTAGYQHLLSRLEGIQQCAAHVIRRCRAVTKLGPGGVQDWAGDVITILRDAHQAVEAAHARGHTALDQQVRDDLRERYDKAVTSGIIHNRLRDWEGGGNHPGYALGTWLREYREQVFLFTHAFAVSWTNNVSEREAKAVKTPSGRLRVLAIPGQPRPLVPPRHQQRHRRKTLATATPRPHLTPIHGHPANGHASSLKVATEPSGSVRIGPLSPILLMTGPWHHRER